MCVVCFETNIPHHQLCFTDAGIVSARIHHVVVGPLHTEHASWMLAGSLVDLSGRIHVPHDDASIHRSRHKSSALRRPTDRRNGALMSQPLARHHRLVFSDLPHFDFAPCVAHSDEAIVQRDSQRVDSHSVILQLVRSHGARMQSECILRAARTLPRTHAGPFPQKAMRLFSLSHIRSRISRPPDTI